MNTEEIKKEIFKKQDLSKLWKYKKEKNIGQRKLAEEIGISLVNLHNILRTNRIETVKTYKKIKDFLNSK